MSKQSTGYGKPPKKDQFKKGQSGNPKGRPRGAKSLGTVVREELHSKLEIKVRGKTRTVTKLEALVMKMANDALSGNSRAQAELIKLAALFAPATPDAASDVLPPSEQDQALLAALFERMAAANEKSGNDDAAPSQ